MTEKCPNGWRGRHRFEARYDTGPVDLRGYAEITGLTTQRLRMFRSITYVRDVCVKCGQVIERAK